MEIHKKHTEEKIIKGIRKVERLIDTKIIVPRKNWNPYRVINEKLTFHFPERIIIHHTAIPSKKEYNGLKTIKKIQKEHLKRGFYDIGYHFIITPEGKALSYTFSVSYNPNPHKVASDIEEILSKAYGEKAMREIDKEEAKKILQELLS